MKKIDLANRAVPVMEVGPSAFAVQAKNPNCRRRTQTAGVS